MKKAERESSVSPCDLPEIICSAWSKTLAKVQSKPSLRRKRSKKRNSKRAKEWVDSLASEFDARYSSSDFHLFWISNKDPNPIDLKLRELLFDIAVCELGTTYSLQPNPQCLKYVAQMHWLVESELDTGNFREILLDMSKLAMGDAQFKLFVAAHRNPNSERRLLSRLRPLACCCGSRLFFAFIEHPDAWTDEQPRQPMLFEWQAASNDWRQFFR